MKSRTLLPTIYESITLLSASTALLGVLCAKAAITHKDAVGYSFISNKLSRFVTTQLDKLNTPLLSTIFTFIIWCVGGALVYVAIWSAASYIKSLKEDVSPLHGLVVPKGYQATLSLPTHIARIAIRSTAMIGLLIWVVQFFTLILPKCIEVSTRAAMHLDLRGILKILLSILALATSIFVFTALTRLVLLRKRVFSQDGAE